MKIYTYYQDIDFSAQQELIDLWKISWSRQGYEPIVLNLEDAKKHSYYTEMSTQLQNLANEIAGKQISIYGMSCWFRWLAYANQTDEKFYVSDYDAINVNFPITEPNDKLHLLDYDCPFLASGTSIQFENLCKAFVNVSKNRLSILKTLTNHYHDQEFFHFNFVERNNANCDELKNTYEILMTRTRDKIGGFYDFHKKECISGMKNIQNINVKEYGVYHISHSNCGQQFNQYPHLKKNYTHESLRIAMIKELLDLN